MLAGRFARRYFFSKKSHAVINLIAGVSVVSLAVPVAAMIVLLSVFNGFEQLGSLGQRILVHIRIESGSAHSLHHVPVRLKIRRADR